MEYQEHPEHLNPFFKKAGLGIVKSLGEFQALHVTGLLEILGATAAGAGCLLARGFPIWPVTIAPLACQIASGHPPDHDEEEDVSTINCYLMGLDANSPETDDRAIITALLQLVSNLDTVGVAAAYGEETRKAQTLAADILAKIRGAHGTSEEMSWLKDELSRWEFIPQASRTKLTLALYYKSLNLLER